MVAVAVAVAIVVDNAARRTKEAARARAEADTLTLLANSVLRGEDALPAMLERIRETFAVTSASLLQRDDPASGWRHDRLQRREPRRPPTPGASASRCPTTWS